MGDDYRIIEQQVGDWHCAFRYRELADGPYDIRWWVAENQKTGKVFSWTYASSEPQPEGDYPTLMLCGGMPLFGSMPRKKRTDEELDGIVDMVKGA